MDGAHRLDRKARAILRLNDRGGYTVPSAGLYPYQWNWDSAFAAFGFAQFDMDRAWRELETLFAGQWDNGMVPHILFHTDDPRYFPGPRVWGCNGPIASSGITQPPVCATIARLMLQKEPGIGRQRMEPLFDKMAAWHRWFMTWRLDRGAVCTTHPWETGRDNAPDWDEAMAAIDPSGVGEYTRRDTSLIESSMRPTKYDYDRYIWLVQRARRLGWDEALMQKETPFRVADPTMTFTLLRAQRDLAHMGRMLGRDTSEIEQAIATLKAGAATLWNEKIGAYDSRNTLTGKWANVVSNASFLCWYAGLKAAPTEQTLCAVLSRVRYGVPSLDPRNPKFDARRYWRGPVWGVMNMLIALGLRDRGSPQAASLRQSTAELICRHGFSEYFDPRDGSPAGGQSFTWTAAIWLGWASPNAEEI